MEIRTQEDVINKIKDFTNELNKLQNAKKMIDDEIKDLKQAYKEEGVAVGIVMKAISLIKKELKESESERVELDLIKDALVKDNEIMDALTALIAK